jgi:hypothetical protein
LIRPPIRWSPGVRSAVCVTFDLDAETAWISRDPANIDRLSVMSQGAYGPKVGVPLILDFLDRNRLPSTFVPGWTAERDGTGARAGAGAGRARQRGHGSGSSRNWKAPRRLSMARAQRTRTGEPAGWPRLSAWPPRPRAASSDSAGCWTAPAGARTRAARSPWRRPSSRRCRCVWAKQAKRAIEASRRGDSPSQA